MKTYRKKQTQRQYLLLFQAVYVALPIQIVLFRANLVTILKALISVLALSRMADTEIVLSTNGRRAQTILLAGNTEQRSYYSLSHF